MLVSGEPRSSCEHTATMAASRAHLTAIGTRTLVSIGAHELVVAGGHVGCWRRQPTDAASSVGDGTVE
jgi:hypothetical protein